MFCWFMFWSGSRYTAGLPAISEGIVSLFSDNPRSENLSIIPDHFFSRFKKTYRSVSIIPLSEVHWLFAQG